MEYLINQKKYSFSYKEVKQKYEEFCSLSDEEFMERIGEALHLACFISYLKELDNEQTIGDEGVVHQLTHLLTLFDPIICLKGIREQFKTLLELV